MKQFFKENWFIFVVIVFFVSISIYFSYDQHKDDLPGKKVDGKDIVFSINGKDYSADDVYSGLYEGNGKEIISNIFINTILDQKIPTTTELKNEVQQYVNYYTQQYQYYGGISYLNNLAQYWGYTDFNEYMTYNIKSRDLCSDYISANYQEFWTDEFVEKYKPRSVSYVLIKMENPENPTEDEKARLAAAKEAWSTKYTVEGFADFAKEYSDDSSTAPSGGVFGYIDTETTDIDEAFKNAALALQANEVTDWVYSKQFGYFLIKCNGTDYETVKGDSSLVSRILTANPNATNEILWKTANELGLNIVDEDVKDFIMSELDINDESEEN